MLKIEHNHGRARHIVLGLATYAAGTVAILWVWNAFAVDILGLPAIRFRHAVALELLVFAASAPLTISRIIRHDTTG
jgi:hypothetical protein